MAEDHTHIIERRERSSGAGWLVAAVLVVAVVVGLIFFSQMSGSETAKDNAVANAAQDVGSAAKDVGSAAKDAASGGN